MADDSATAPAPEHIPHAEMTTEELAKRLAKVDDEHYSVSVNELQKRGQFSKVIDFLETAKDPIELIDSLNIGHLFSAYGFMDQSDEIKVLEHRMKKDWDPSWIKDREGYEKTGRFLMKLAEGAIKEKKDGAGAIHLLGEMKYEPAVPLLVSELERRPVVAMFVLAAIGSADAQRALLDFVKAQKDLDADPAKKCIDILTGRSWTSWVVSGKDAGELLELLVPVARDRHAGADLRRVAIRSLGKLRDDRALPAFEAVLG